MKLTELRIENFKNHAASTLHFSPHITTLVGKQGSGKTSVCDALVALFIGRTRLTTKNGVGLKDHIRHGQKEYKLDLVCENSTGKIAITRTQSMAKQTLIYPKGDTLDARQGILLQDIGLSGSSEAIECLLDPGIFADRDPEEQCQILRKLIKTKNIIVPKEVLSYGIRELAGISSIEDHIKSLKGTGGAIPQLNKEIKDLVASMPVEPDQEEYTIFRRLKTREAELGVTDHDTTARLGALRQKLETARTALLQREQAAKAKVELAKKEKELAALAEQLTAINAQEVERLKKEISEKESALKTVTEKLQALSKDVRTLQASVQSREADRAKLEGNTRQAKEDLEDLLKMGDACPKCKRALPPAELKIMRTALEKQLHEAKDTLDFVGLGLKHEREQLALKDKEGKKLKGEHDVLQEQLRPLRINLKYPPTGTERPMQLEHRDEFARYEQCSKDVTNLKISIGNVQVEWESPATIESEISKLSYEAGQVTTDLESVRKELSGMDTETRAERAQQSQGSLRQARAKLEKATMALESLGKLKDDLLKSDEASKFTKQLNSLWKRFYPDTEVLASTEGVSVKDSTGEVQASYLSTGQKVILDAAIRVAAAKTTGFGILAMDDANKLPQEELGKLFKALRESEMQVLLLQTTSAVPKAAPDGVVIYKLNSPSLFGPAECVQV